MERRKVDPIARLIQALSRLPGVGEKSATRMAFYVLRQGPTFAADLAESLLEATQRVSLCARCQNLTDQAECGICADPQRDVRVLCVVENVQDLRAIERSQEFKGRYHVLHGTLAPLEGIGPEGIKVKELLSRLAGSDRSVEELIVATNPSVEGEATALYLQRVLQPMGFTVTRIASGLPIGGDFEYADPATISRALSGRQRMS
ncbi:MAG: recombination protein RecR [Deltaproteobacteria bacterium]|jgi:recombination protein RecR|nr:recombination protein RecR [Deltaproteobacteria bacterium]